MQFTRFLTLAILFAVLGASCLSGAQPVETTQTVCSNDDVSSWTLETVVLHHEELSTTVHLAYCPGQVKLHPVILMLGSLVPGQLPPWSVNLVREGYMLAAFTVAHPPDKDPARRPQWLCFDERFAHSYVLGGSRAPADTARVIDYLLARGDVHSKKIGWLGSSSTGIPGLAVATREPRLTAIVAFVSTGAYRQWLETWHTNGLWRGGAKGLWPETEELLRYDPILHVKGLYPKAVLMVSGGEDKVVDPKTAQAFFDAAKPYYAEDPSRLRLVVYHGMSHNLPEDVVRMYAENWFHLYMHPAREAPSTPAKPGTLHESAARTHINAADHKEVVGAQ